MLFAFAGGLFRLSCLIFTPPFLILSGFNFLLLNKFLFATHSLRVVLRCFFLFSVFEFTSCSVFFLFWFVSLRNHFKFFFSLTFASLYEHTFNYIKSIIVYRSDYAARVSIVSLFVVTFSFSYVL